MNGQITAEANSVKLSNKQFAGTIAGLQLILLLAALDQTIITTAMPRIVAELGGFERYAWATTSYLLTSTVSVPVFGRLSDIYGRKPLLLAGIALFIIASILCGGAGILPMGDAMTQLIVARAMQGLGGGIMLGLAFTVVADILPPAERGRYQGHFAAVFALSSIFEPVLGGWVADKLSWRWLFFVNLPVGAIGMYVFARAFPARKRTEAGIQRLDIAGITVFTTLLVTLLLALGWIAESGLSSQHGAIALASFTALLLLFIAVERKAQHPLMPLSLFVRPVIAIASISLFVTGIGMFGSVLLIPLFLQSVMGLSATISGALLTPLIITVAGSSVAGGICLSRTKKYKSLILFALALMSAGVFCLSRIDANSTLPLIIAYMLVVGVGMGLLLPVYTIVIQNAVEQSEIGTVTGFGQFFRSVGGTVGVAAFGSMMLASYRNQLLSPLITQPVLSAIENPLQPAKLQANLAKVLVREQDIAAVLLQVRHALVTSIDSVFAVYAGALVATLLLTIFLDEIPLRAAAPSSAHSGTA